MRMNMTAAFRKRLAGALEGVPFREIAGLSWPQMMTVLCGVVISLTDTWVAGRISPEAQGSVGVSAQVQIFLMVFAMALGTAGMASVSQSMGAYRIRRAQRYVGLILALSMVLSVILGGTVWCLRDMVLLLLGVPSAMLHDCSRMMGIMLAGLPVFYVVQVGGTLFRAGRCVVLPLFILACACIVNVAGDLLFGLGCCGVHAFGVDGIAWSTCAANAVGAALTFFYLKRIGLVGKKVLSPSRWAGAALPYLLRVALPACGNSIVWNAGYLVMFAIAGGLPDGVAVLAGMTAGNRIESMLYMPAGAFMATASILVGNALGAGDRAAARRAGTALFWISAVVMGAVGACMWPFLDDLAACFSGDPPTRRQIVDYLVFNVLAVPFTVSGMALHGVMNGAGATVYSCIVNGASIWLVRLPLGWVLSRFVLHDAQGLYFAMLFSMVIQTSAMVWVFLRRDWAAFAMRARVRSGGRKRRGHEAA